MCPFRVNQANCTILLMQLLTCTPRKFKKKISHYKLKLNWKLNLYSLFIFASAIKIFTYYYYQICPFCYKFFFWMCIFYTWSKVVRAHVIEWVLMFVDGAHCACVLCLCDEGLCPRRLCFMCAYHVILRSSPHPQPRSLMISTWPECNPIRSNSQKLIHLHSSKSELEARYVETYFHLVTFNVQNRPYFSFYDWNSIHKCLIFSAKYLR